ncbi:cilia- and flagella-associated protein 54 isoform X1 [Takifugu rubripes]|uniref:cilia- and flagella-associated protein 54 isoform X1 n=1 Tax=Takifugu rubripes TaxID=31033 RepID=UPI001145EDCD|nr:cilia- and flagella-associated protein 54 isoform X1 [Takifugu rubripes]
MDLPATHYGKLDNRNPVVSVFERDVKTFQMLMRRVTCASSQDNSSYAKGIKTLVEIWKKYKHRLPSKMYEERMLQVADFLVEIEMYEVALWQGYSLHLFQFSPLKITEVADVDQFMASFFPEGLDVDQDTFTLKIRAMLGCALCMLEREKRRRGFSQMGLCNLLQVLSFLRIMMQVLQQHEHLCWHVYNVSLHIYRICYYLMTMNCSAQALEYLLWASVSLELSVPIMTPEHLPWIVTLYCAVCRCYYDSQLPMQAEEFARRALGKIEKLARWEQENDVPVSRETQSAFREASIKLAALVFKRLVFENRKKIKPVFKPKTKLPNVPWPRTTTERALMSLFDSSAGYFVGILEALRDTGWCPQKKSIPEEPDQQEVIVELLSAGLSVLSGAGSEPLGAVTTTSTLMELAIAGENKVNVSSALSFIKLLFHFKQAETCGRLTKEMQQVLSALEGQSFRKAESELALLGSLNSLLCAERSRGRDDLMPDVRRRSLFQVSEELAGLVRALHSSVCLLSPEIRPDGGLVLDVVLFLWNKVKEVMQGDELQNPSFTYCVEKIDNFDKWLWCLFVLCEVTSVCDPVNMDCMVAAEMHYMLAVLLERAAESRHLTSTLQADPDEVRPTTFSLTETSRTELFQKVCEVVEWGFKALEKDGATMISQDGSAITDSVFMQKGHPVLAFSSPWGPTKVEGESKGASDNQDFQHTESTPVSLLAKDLYLELLIIQHRASLKLMLQNGVTESELLGRIKKNKVPKAVFLIQKALLVHTDKATNDSKNQIKSLLEEASSLIDKASVEERKLYHSNTFPSPAENEDNKMKNYKDDPPPAPILLSRTDTTLTFTPAPYNLQGQLCWYQLYGRAVEGVDQKVRVGDWSLKGTGNLVPAVPGECLLKIEGLEPNQKYVFAVAVYNTQGNMLGSSIGAKTLPILASMPIPLVSTWVHMAQVAYQTEQFALAKRACRTLWSHFTFPDNGSQRNQDRLATTTGLHTQILQCGSLHLCRRFLTSIFIETEINIQQGSLSFQSFSNNGPFIWEQEARLEECERMLVAMDLALWLNDGISALQAVVVCYGLLTPLIFHQVKHSPFVEVLKKCLVVLEVISSLPKQKWTGRTSESFVHMIACITYYLAKTLRTLRETQAASVMLDSGRKLLKKAHEAWLHMRRLSKKTECITAVRGEKVIPLLRALLCKNRKTITCEAADNEVHPLTGSLTSVYNQISNSTLTAAYQHVMKLRSKPYFVEVAAQLLQRAMEEGHTRLVLKWGKSLFQSLSRDEDGIGLSKNSVEQDSQSNKGVHQNNSEPPQNKTPACKDDKRKILKQKMPCSMLQKVQTNREVQIVENLIARMTSVVERNKKQIQHRNQCCEERVWKSHLNYSLAKACLQLLYQSLAQSHRGSLECRYSQVDPLCFSLPSSGILLWKNTQQELSWKNKLVSEETLAVRKHVCKEKPNIDLVDDSVSESSEEEETAEQQINRQNCAELFNRAALHLRRAMVLAHRGSLWNLLRSVCQTVWDHSCRIGVFAAQRELPVAPEQLQDTLTSLLVLSADLIMDMMHRLGLWSLYDGGFTEEERDSALHYSSTLDDSTRVDLRWVHALVLHTLERLHDRAKWESLAHFGLVFNSYTRDHYASIVTPLIINAQRRLLERINLLGGPAVPQPHHVKTQKTSGKEVTYSTYAGLRLVSGWAPLPRPETKGLTPPDTDVLKDAEIQRSLCLVRVPLNVEDTLSCYQQALERRPHCLLVFQRSRALLLRLLANTMPCFAAPFHHSAGRRQVKFDPSLDDVPSVQSLDLYEDFSKLSAVCKLPVSPDNMMTVTDAFSATIKYLGDSGKNVLRVVALHEMGNLQFYNDNKRAAHSYWSKAVDCALQSSRAIEKWDGLSIGGSSMEKTFKHAGIWGCLHAAGLIAKTAQYTLTSDINQRTKYCLLSAHLFKCVLRCSMAQPLADLQFAHHSIGEELLPGTDLFSEPHRVHLGTTVSSLKFLCHWLFTKGFYTTLLPMLALYLHLVGTVCRDVERTVEGKILKIRALTELRLFAEAVKESVELIGGPGIPLPFGPHVVHGSPQPMRTFYNSKCLQDNTEALEELGNGDFAPDTRILYGSTLCLRYNLARVQLILGLCDTIHDTGPPVAGSLDGPDSAEAEAEAGATMTSSAEKLNQDAEGSCLKPEEPKPLNLTGKEKLSQAQLKLALLDGASSLLCAASEQLSSEVCSEAEILELTVEANLLRNNLYLQQGQFARSAETAVSSLALLQTSPVITGRSSNDAGIGAEQRGDAFRAVEASERIGAHLWLRCRLALFQSLAAEVSGGVPPLQGKTREALQVLQDALHECTRWGEPDVQGLLMFEGAKLEVQRGNTGNGVAMLKETINLLSGETQLPPGSTLTVARAILLLHELREGPNTALLKLLYGLIKNELCAFGESVVLENGQMRLFPPEPSNVYLPHLRFLQQEISK